MCSLALSEYVSKAIDTCPILFFIFDP